MKDISKMLEKEIIWKPLPESERDFISENFIKEDCYLRMNNFPEDPLWTLFYKG